MANQQANELAALDLPLQSGDILLAQRGSEPLKKIAFGDLQGAVNSDMPSTMLNQAGKVLVANATEDANVYADLATGFFNLKPENYLRTRAALAGVVGGLANTYIYFWCSENQQLQEDGYTSYKHTIQQSGAKALQSVGINASCNNFFGIGNSALANWNSSDLRVANLAAAWTDSTGFGFKRWINTSTTDPFIFRPMDTTGARNTRGAQILTDTCDVWYEDAASGTQDVFTVKAGTLGAAKTITGITKANPAVLNIVGHGLSVNDHILLECDGMLQFASHVVYVHTVVDADNIQVRFPSSASAVNSTSFGTFTAGTAKLITLTNATATTAVTYTNNSVVRKAVFTSPATAIWFVQKSATNTNRLAIQGFNCYDSSVKQVSVLRTGNWVVDSFSGTAWDSLLGALTSTNVNSGVAGGNATTAQPKIPLLIIDIGLLEAYYGSTSTSIVNYLNGLITAAKTAGMEVILALDWERIYTFTTKAKADAVRYGVYQAADANDVGVIDIGLLQGSPTNNINAGMLGAGGLRLTPSGAMNVGNIVAQGLLSLFRQSDVHVKNSVSNYIPNKLPLGSGNVTVTKSFFGTHAGKTNLSVPSTYNFGLYRSWDGGASAWADIEPTAGNYDFTKLDAVITAAWAKGITRFMFTFGIIPSHAVNVSWYNSINAIARNTFYAEGEVRRPATGNGCIYK